jgi:hypothetical protein
VGVGCVVTCEFVFGWVSCVIVLVPVFMVPVPVLAMLVGVGVGIMLVGVGVGIMLVGVGVGMAFAALVEVVESSLALQPARGRQATPRRRIPARRDKVRFMGLGGFVSWG